LLAVKVAPFVAVFSKCERLFRSFACLDETEIHLDRLGSRSLKSFRDVPPENLLANF